MQPINFSAIIPSSQPEFLGYGRIKAVEIDPIHLNFTKAGQNAERWLVVANDNRVRSGPFYGLWLDDGTQISVATFTFDQSTWFGGFMKNPDNDAAIWGPFPTPDAVYDFLEKHHTRPATLRLLNLSGKQP